MTQEEEKVARSDKGGRNPCQCFGVDALGNPRGAHLEDMGF